MNVKHRMTRSPTYRVWYSIKQRCDNPRAHNYRIYGGRGISYDPRWTSFENFLADMGLQPAGLQIDRIDTNGNYSKSNCRWVTCRVNQNNKRNNRVVEFRGERLTVAELARKVGMTHDEIYQRIRRGWSVDAAVSTPFQRRQRPEQRA